MTSTSLTGRTLVTGGAGFVGCHLAHDLLRDGMGVTILDSLSRRGAALNLEWLQSEYAHADLRVINGDIRDATVVAYAVQDADVIYHLAGQVAVTSSVQDPRHDFEINALGTLNVLEAARLSAHRPIVVFTSTNKVYGGMEGVEVVEADTRYEYRDFPEGISEAQPLDFHSPYGCSKGAADQYVRDYARIYGLRTVVFRMSCIYGPRQFGNEDQGWLAHFMIAAATGRPVTIYGDGKQVRDVLFVDDLVRAFRLSIDKIDTAAGEIYNVGGGSSNTVSVWREFGEMLADMHGDWLAVEYDDWRPGDQLCYVSDIRKIRRHLCWEPRVDPVTGAERLWKWVAGSGAIFGTPAPATLS
jgi:CDP-paratose 2-epimerase